MPGFVFKPGKIGIVSKSGTLTYEAADQIVKAGLGISTAIGIGGDPVIGTSTKEAVEFLMNDPDTDAIVMIGGNWGVTMKLKLQDGSRSRAIRNQLWVLLQGKPLLRAEGWGMQAPSLVALMILPKLKWRS